MKRTYAISTPSKKSRSTTVTKYKSRPRQVPVSGMVTIPNTYKYGLGAFPAKLKNTVRYHENVAGLTLAVGTGTYFFSCNGLYDPNVTATGHQPLYFDQLMTIYNHYTVVSSKITAKICGNSDANYNITLYIEDDGTASSALAYPWERAGAVSIFGNPLIAPLPVMTMRWDAVKNFGPSALDDPEMQGNSGNNPTEQQYFCFVATDNLSANTTLYMDILIEYTTIWDELKTIATS